MPRRISTVFPTFGSASRIVASPTAANGQHIQEISFSCAWNSSAVEQDPSSGAAEVSLQAGARRIRSIRDTAENGHALKSLMVSGRPQMATDLVLPTRDRATAS